MVPTPRRGAHAVQRWPLSVMGLAAATGFLFVTAAISSGGDDLRPTGGDVASLVSDRGREVDGARRTARDLRTEIDELSRSVSTGPIAKLQRAADELLATAGLTAVDGPGVEVVLTDAPRSAYKDGIDPKLLVVHEQDLQAYVNALWAGGADAVALQGQRLISTTGIKCVGNTVLLDGVPYSPPYRITAVGDVAAMVDSLSSTPGTATYADYSRQLGLGLDVTTLADTSVPAYAGTVSLRYAAAITDD